MENNGKKIKITFVGDIMSKIQQNNASKCKNGNYNYDKIFKNVEKDLKKSSFLVGNLETPIAGETMKYSNVPFSFNTPEEFVIALRNAGFDMVTTANNHCLDRGIDGLKLTIDNLNKIGLEHIGTYKNKNDRDKIYIKEIGGIKFAFISYTYGTNANINNIYLNKENKFYVNILKKQEEKNVVTKNIFLRTCKKIQRKLKLDKQYIFSYYRDKEYLQQFIEDIKLAKKQSNYVIFCMHSGGQYNAKEDRYTKKLSEFAIKNGVDFVIGCHPHVVHGSKIIKNNKFIAYSLGNFCSTPYTNSKQKDDLPDYSIVLNLYFNQESKNLENITFNVVKSILDENGYSYLEFADSYLKKIDNNDLRRKIEKDIIQIVNRFYNLDTLKIEREYIVL